jgi:hypothetical protein
VAQNRAAERLGSEVETARTAAKTAERAQAEAERDGMVVASTLGARRLSLRVHAELTADGQKLGEKCVARLMRAGDRVWQYAAAAAS